MMTQDSMMILPSWSSVGTTPLGLSLTYHGSRFSRTPPPLTKWLSHSRSFSASGKLHDVHALDMLLPEAGAIYVVDRGYVDFARLHVLTSTYDRA